MSNDWSNSLKQTLANLRIYKSPRIAIIGIGQELRGDDALGPMIVRSLKPRLTGKPSVLILDGGQSPENQTGALRRFIPDLVILIDAAQMNTTNGEVRWLPLQQLDGLSASTHTQPLSMIAQYLNTELGCEIALIGIQPAQMTFGADLSPMVQEALRNVVEGITSALFDS